MVFFRRVSFYWMPVIVWAIIMLFVSAMPGEAIEAIDGGGGKVSSYSYIWHFFEFLVFSFLLFRALNSFERPQGRSSFVAVIAVCLLFSFVTEFVQIYVPGRFFDFSDIFVNNLGVIAGLGRYVLAR